MGKRSVAVAVSVACAWATAATAWAADPLALDDSFGGGDGWVTVAVGSSASAAGLVRDADGNIVMAGRSDGDIAVVRVGPGGAPDGSFGGGDGIATLDLGGIEAVSAVALDAQGRIVVVGTGDPDLFVVRFDADGQPDGAFDGDGIVRYHAVAADTFGEDVSIDGSRILVAGTLDPQPGADRLLLLRFRTSGTLDDGFGGGNGIVTTRIKGATTGEGLSIDGKGRPVVAGRSAHDGDGDVAVARFTSSGALDATFGGDGRALLDFDPNGDDAAEAVDVQPGGNVVVAGTLHTDGGKAIAIVGRLNTDGTPDADFGANARRRLGLAAPAQALHDVLVEPDDDLTVTGQANGDVLIATLSPDGRTVSWRTVDPVGGSDQGNGVLRLGSGRLLVAGRIADIPSGGRAITLTPQFGLLRFLPA